MRENIIKTKSFDFAVEIVYLYKDVVAQHKEFMSKQFLRSGTSIGANIREAELINKMTINLKEANETGYWSDLLNRTGYIEKEKFIQFKQKIEELLKLLVSIVKSSKK